MQRIYSKRLLDCFWRAITIDLSSGDFVLPAWMDHARNAVNKKRGYYGQ